MNVLLLAAGRGRRFGKRTRSLPKCLIPLRPGVTLLSRYLDAFRTLRLQQVFIVVGHEKEKIMREAHKHGHDLHIRFVENEAYKKGSVVSLQCAAFAMDADCLIMDADVFFDPSDLKKLLKTKKSAFLIDPRSVSTGEEMMLMTRGGRPVKIAKKVDPRLGILGEATGFFKVSKADAPLLAKTLSRMVSRGITDVEYEDAYNTLMKTRRVQHVPVKKFWSEMDFEADLKKIREHLARP